MVLHDSLALFRIAEKIEANDVSANKDFIELVAYEEEMPASKQGGALVKHHFWLHNNEEMYYYNLDFFCSAPHLFNILNELKIKVEFVEFTKKNKTNVNPLRHFDFRSSHNIVITIKFKEFISQGGSRIDLIGLYDNVNEIHKVIYKHQNAAAIRALAFMVDVVQDARADDKSFNMELLP